MIKKRNIIIVIFIISTIILFLLFLKLFPRFVLKSEAIAPFETNSKVEIGDEIPIKKGEVLIANSNNKKLYLDTDLLTIRIVDDKTGKEWTSKVDVASNTKEQSIINISYYGKDDKTVEWDAYSFVVEKGNYAINKIENGARVTLNFQTDNKKPEQLVPMYMKKELYEERFLKPLESLKENGNINSKQYSSFKDILGSVYTKTLDSKGYKLSSSGISPKGAKILSNFVETIGYTTDMLREDNEAANIEISIPQSASFKIVLDLTLDNGDLVANIPTYECTSLNDFYTLLSIEVLPTLGYASSQKTNEGYIFVPDGSGALFELNGYNASYPHYKRPIYNNTYFDKMYEMDTFKEGITMPVFGIMYGKDETAQGMFGIVESGEELGSINAQLGSKDNSTGGVNNKVFTSVDISQYSRVKLQGPYSEDSTRYLVSTGKINMDYKVRYKFFAENATYNEFAKTYKEYLMDKYSLEEKYSSEPKIYFEVLGALTLKEFVAGVPYNKIVSMTTYDELNQIINETGDMNAIFEYNGAFNNGEKTTLMNNVKLVSQNGSKEDLSKLIETSKDSSKEILLGTSLMTIKDNTLAFDPKIHSIIGYDSKPAKIYKYNLIDGKFSPNKTDERYLLNPKYLKDVMDNFINKTKDFANIAITDIPNTFYANYNVKDIINPIDTNNIIERELSKLSETKRLSFKNPNMNTLPYADIATDISRESSQYGTMYISIPFRQLTFNGLVEYTTLNANMSKKDIDYYLLQALELGSYPKFKISYKKEDILKDSDYTNLINTHFETLKPRINKLYNDYEKAFSNIGTTEIENHIILQEGVFETTYKNGVKVITNYNLNDVMLEDLAVKSMGYRIIK
ncbi:MAG: hypothetical protein KIC92_06235 [Clostridiales bacterium]|nr:hypothetical protein [Clostridiales bacterium]